jgi:hypothetical protein
LFLKKTASILLLVVLGVVPRAAAQLPGAQLIVTPPGLSFPTITANMPVVAAPPLTVQVVSPGQRPWRVLVMPLGPLQSDKGSQIPSQQVSWQASPAGVFINGALSAGQPQLVARGQGSKVGVLRFFLKNSWEFPAGNYSQRLLFTLSSP